MSSVRWGLFLAVACTVACGPKGAASPGPAAAEPAPAAPATAPAPAPTAEVPAPAVERGSRFGRAFHNDVSTFAVVHDLELLAERVLSWPVTGELAGAVEPGLTVAALRAKLDESRAELPLEIAFGLREAGTRQFGRWVRAFLTVGLLYGASDVGDASAAEALQRDLVGALDAIELPPMVVYARLRSPAQADQFAMGARLLMGQLASATGLPGSQISGDTTVFEATLADVVDRQAMRTALEDALPEVMVGTEADNQRVADAVVQLRLRVELVVSGSELTVKLGPGRPPNARPFRDWALAALPATDDLLALHVGYDMRPLMSEAREWTREWTRWRDTPVGHATRRLDTTDLLGNLEQLTELLDRGATRGALRLALGAEPTVSFAGWEADREGAASLADSELLTRVPWTPERAIVLSTTTPVGTGLLRVRDQFEENVADMWLEGLFDDDLQKQQTSDSIEEVYYREMATLRKLLRELPDRFAGENALLVGPGARFRRIRVPHNKVTVDGDQVKEEQGAWEVSDVPAYHVLLVGRPKKPGTGTRLHAAVLREFAAGLGRIVGRRVKKPVVSRKNLGLGVPTTVLRGGWINDLGQAGFELDFDGTPHMFDKDGWWVFSTSVEWSKAFLAGGRAPAPALPAGVVVDYVDVGPGFFGATAAELAGALERLAGRAAAAEFGPVLRLVGPRMNIRYWVEQRGSDRLSTGWWSLAPAGAKAN